jgi:hypothetical protein
MRAALVASRPDSHRFDLLRRALRLVTPRSPTRFHRTGCVGFPVKTLLSRYTGDAKNENGHTA